MTNARNVIISLKTIKKERGLSVDDILEMVEANGEYLSKSTVARIFAEGSEDKANTFRYENSLRPIANALLDVDNIEDEDDMNILGFKTVLQYNEKELAKKDNKIAELEEELKSVKQHERDRYNKLLDKETDNFNKSISFAKEQIKLKDERIDKHMAEKDKVTSILEEVVATNNRLVQQMMNCPLKKEEG